MMKKAMENFTVKRTVLLVEDNEMNREILCDLLLDEYNVIQAENGLEGLKQLEEHGNDISVILLDVYMPECDGFEFLERKKDSRFPSVPVIMMTASGSVEDEIRCLDLGASDFITKPYNIEVLKNRMKSMIRLRESSAMLSQLELDELTGLYSKELFYHNATTVLRVHPNTHYDIVCSDIVNFRAMNERYGRPQCDLFLRYLAGSISQTLPDIVIGGRIGADIFAFMIQHQEEDWTGILKQNPEDSIGSFNFLVKYGIMQDIDKDTSIETACDRATLAINRIKGKFNTNIAWFDDDMRRMQLQEHQILQDVQEAMREHQFQVYYQPKHNLQTNRTGGAEALVRWIHPQMGFVNPGAFIPLFERNGFITQLDFYIWEEVCQEIQHCLQQGIPVVPISVNVSRMDFDVPDLAEKISDLADRYGVDHSLLHIELTESIYGENPTRIAATLEELHERGFVIELDDFGAGYSSLSSLNTLKLDIMKLDMSIIRQASATKNYSILRYAVLLAEGMRLKIVAEGVETAEQVEALKVLGCDYIQGYYYSKPLPHQDFEAYVSAQIA